MIVEDDELFFGQVYHDWVITVEAKDINLLFHFFCHAYSSSAFRSLALPYYHHLTCFLPFYFSMEVKRFLIVVGNLSSRIIPPTMMDHTIQIDAIILPLPSHNLLRKMVYALFVLDGE